MNKVGEVTTIIKDHVQWFSIREDKGLLDTPDILFVGLSLPGIDWDTCLGNSCGSMVLGGEDVTRRPLNL